MGNQAMCCTAVKSSETAPTTMAVQRPPPPPPQHFTSMEPRVREHDFQKALALAQPKPMNGGSATRPESSPRPVSSPRASSPTDRLSGGGGVRFSEPVRSSPDSRIQTTVRTTYQPRVKVSHNSSPQSPFMAQPNPSDRPVQYRPNPPAEETAVRASAPNPSYTPSPGPSYKPSQPDFSPPAVNQPAAPAMSQPAASVGGEQAKERLRSIFQQPFSIVSTMRKSSKVPAQEFVWTLRSDLQALKSTESVFNDASLCTDACRELEGRGKMLVSLEDVVESFHGSLNGKKRNSSSPAPRVVNSRPYSPGAFSPDGTQALC